MNSRNAELFTQMFQEYRKPFSGAEILEEINELLRLEVITFDVPQRIQFVITSLETNINLAGIESVKYYRMIQELIMKLIAELAKNHQTLAGSSYKASMLSSEQFAWTELSFKAYEMIGQALLEQYRAVALQLLK